jgi:predicted nucleic acid-binding protein
MKTGEAVFVDTGAWIAMALTRDPLHPRAREEYSRLKGAGARFVTSVPVILETFTFLDRNTARGVALAWRGSLKTVPRLKILGCSTKDIEAAWPYFERNDLHKLSAVDAVSFVLMTRHGIKKAFAFDVHFSVAGFRAVG